MLEVHASGDQRKDLSILNLVSACSFSRAAWRIEAEHAGEPFGPFWEDIFANASASVHLTVAALEPYLNELFADRLPHFAMVDEALFEKQWQAHQRDPFLKKVKLALKLRGAEPMETDQTAWKDVGHLVELRNNLFHYHTEWIGDKRNKGVKKKRSPHAQLANRLAGLFATSSHFPGDEPDFPRRWATHAAASWVVEAAIAFIDAFDDRARLPSHLASVRDRLRVR
jgi:hypothetical protein